MSKPVKPPYRVGHQEHVWMYGGDNPWKKKPYSFWLPGNGKPNAVLRRLVEKRWMWVQREMRYDWKPPWRNQDAWWSGPVPSTLHAWTGLTDKGLEVIEAIRKHSHDEYEREKTEREKNEESS